MFFFFFFFVVSDETPNDTAIIARLSSYSLFNIDICKMKGNPSIGGHPTKYGISVCGGEGAMRCEVADRDVGISRETMRYG